MVAGVDQGESTRAVAVVDVGGVGINSMSLQGHSEAPQRAPVAPHWVVVGVGSDGPQSSLHLICAGHGLKGLQQQKCTVLALSCSMQEREQKYQFKSGKMMSK